MPEVEFEANGGTATGYLTEPDGDDCPGVVVLQEWWGLDEHIRKICDRLAAEGFIALAPDLFHGETTEQPSEAEQKMMALNIEEAEKEMRGAVDYVASHPKSNGRIGTVGFCLGGGLSIWAATANPKVDAAVTYYYVMPHGKPDFAKLSGKPVQGHFGTADEYISEEDAAALAGEMAEAGADVEFHYYEGAGHAFSGEHNRIGTHDPEHAKIAWDRTIEFFGKHLNGGDPEIEHAEG